MSMQRMIVVSATLLFVFFPCTFLHAQTTIDTDIVSDTTWTLAESPYVVTTSIAVMPDTLLTIDPGVVVKYAKNVSMTVFGTIHVVGAESAPITFTSLQDDSVAGDTNHDRKRSVPSVGDWDGIYLLGEGAQLFSHVVLSYGVNGFNLQDTDGQFDSVRCSYTTECFVLENAHAQMNAITIDHPNGELINAFSGSTADITTLTLSNLESVTHNDFFTSFIDSAITISHLVSDATFTNEVAATFLGSTLHINDASLSTGQTRNDAFAVFDDSTLALDNVSLKGGNGDGIAVFSGGNLSLINSAISHFGDAGIATFSQDGDPQNTVTLDHSILSFNTQGVGVYDAPAITTDTLSIHDNNAGVVNYGTTTLPFLQTWWGDASGPTNAITNPDGRGNSVSDTVNFIPYLTEDPFHEAVVPKTYYAKITGFSQGFANVRDIPSASATLVKTLPIDYIVHVIEETDANGQSVIADGYQWYKVEDPTDGTSGWVVVAPIGSSTPIYLPYSETQQQELFSSATMRFDGDRNLDNRRQTIIDAIDHYLSNTDTNKSLYSSDDTIKISDLATGLPKELILAIIAQESGGVKFNNEFVTYDYGHGIMQLSPDAWSHESTTDGYKNNRTDNIGIYSLIKNKLCTFIGSNQYKKCYVSVGDYKKNKPYDFYEHISSNPKYKQYGNTKQSIYANIKDGLGVLVSKYNLGFSSKCKNDSYTVEGETFTCDDLKKIKTVWAYNGVVTAPANNYLQLISQKLATLSNYFPGYTYDDSDRLIEKLAIANRHRSEIKVHSPVDLRVNDISTNETTGVVNGGVVEDIDNSVYDPDTEGALILFPEDEYKYTLVGNDTGSYGIDVNKTSTSGDIQQIFSATDVPVQDGAVHTITLDETLLAQGGNGATIAIDTNADGVPEQTIVGGSVLHDVVPPTIDMSSIADEYLLGQKVLLNHVATDETSSADHIVLTASLDDEVLPIVSNTALLNTIGTHTLTITATDEAGNIATAIKTIVITYILNAITISPKNDTNTYPIGSKITIRFILRGRNKVSVPIDRPGIALIRRSDGYSVPINPDTTDENGYCDLGEECFTRIDSTYRFKLNTALLSKEMWDIMIPLSDGTTHRSSILVQ